MPMAQVAEGHFKTKEVGEPQKRMVNRFSEPNTNDPGRPLRLLVRPGSLKRDAGVLQNTPRGIAQTDGHANGDVLVVDGDTVRTYDAEANTWGELTGTLAGTDRVQTAFSEVEGAFLADGKIYVSDGSDIRCVSDSDAGSHDGADGASILTDSTKAWTPGQWVGYTITNETDGSSGTITANDATTITAILEDGTDNDWDIGDTYTIGNAFTQLLADHGQTKFTSIASIGQRLIFTFGSRFGYSSPLNFGETTTLNFYTAEGSPDALVAVKKLQGKLYLFGTETIEPWVQTGSNDAPFRPQATSDIDRGAAARDTIEKLDNTLFFVGDDLAPYRLSGLVPQMLTPDEPWVAELLKDEEPASLVATTLEFGAHKFYIIRSSVGTFVYSLMRDTWVLWETKGLDVWEWAEIVRSSTKSFAISGNNARFAELSRDYEGDYKSTATSIGTEIITEWTAHLPVLGDRRKLVTVRVDGTKGRGSANNSFAAGEISMAMSKDGGRSITTAGYRSRSTGAVGEYCARTIWRRNGRTKEPQVVLFFRSNDPGAVTGVAVNED